MESFFYIILTALLILKCEGLAIEKKKSEKFDVKSDDFCKGKNNSKEYIRISTDDCKTVIRCSPQGMNTIRCQAGLAFDIELQTCNWQNRVENCEMLQKPKLVQPLLSTTKPLCEPEKLACGNGQCIGKELFCDGQSDCSDNSDENFCSVDKDPNAAPFCDLSKCVLPNCFCSFDGTAIPGKLEASKVPQMVTITFDDAINNNNIDIYQKIFNEERKNPNGCKIKSTFFVSHKYTNYSAVQEMHRLGHEIAVHSITHESEEKYWNKANIETWTKEMAGSRMIIEKFANITDNSLNGVRSPNLRLGGNVQFQMMEDQGFLYDSTITAKLSNPPLWPYFLQYRMPHSCYGDLQLCPTRSRFIWEMVMNEYDRRENPEFDEHVTGCSMIDSCGNLLSGKKFYNFLEHNFKRHYLTNRAPFGLYFHASWLKMNPELLEAFLEWLDDTLKKPDVYFLTMVDVLKWIQNPTELSDLKDFQAWKNKCDVKGPPVCFFANPCPLMSLDNEEIRLHTCLPCPEAYPWLENPLGNRN